MSFYWGMNLRARDCQVCVIDEDLSVLVQQKVRNELSSILRLIEPFKVSLQMMVESTFTWYGLVDGLQEAGYAVCLAHTLGPYLIPGAKVKTDRRDALALAKLLKAGMIPKAYSYPKATRPIRDLLRQRSRLVALCAAAYGSLRRLLLRHGRLAHSRNDIKRTAGEDIERGFADPLVRLHGQHELQRLELFSHQIASLESPRLATVQDRPELHRMLTVPGLGQILAMTIFYDIGAIERFQTTRECSAYCRLVPVGLNPAPSVVVAVTPSRGARTSSGRSVRPPLMRYGTTQRSDAASSATWGTIAAKGANSSPMRSLRISWRRPFIMASEKTPAIERRSS
jgi:transposase